MKSKNKKDDLNIIKQAANLYEKNLNNKTLLFIYLNRKNNKIEFYEVTFKDTYFKHLTGTTTPISSRMFYRKALTNTLKIEDFDYKDNNTNLKLDNIIRGMEINKYARMIGYFENNRKYLTLDKVAGTQYLSIGFDSDKNYNYPKTFLVGDIRKLTIGKPNRVLCVLSKNIKDIKYEQIVYIAKNVDIEKLKCNKEIQEKLS